MHEASIAQSILDVALEQCGRAGYKRVTVVRVSIGSATGVLAEALQMAFEIARMETLAESAKLVITEVPLGGLCTGCSERFTTTEPFLLACPNCGATEFRFDSGRELDITEIEVD